MIVNNQIPESSNPDPESRLSALIDGELGDRAKEKLERELHDEPGLETEFQALRDLDRLLEDRPDPGEAPDLRAAVLARVNRSLGSSASRRGRWIPNLSALWPASWAAGGAFCALMSASLLQTEAPAATPAAEVTPFEDAMIAAMASGDSLADPLAQMFGSAQSQTSEDVQ